MKNILVHVDGSARSLQRLHLAVTAAQRHAARLTGVFGYLAPPQRVGVVASWPSEAYRDATLSCRQAFEAATAPLDAPAWIDANRGSASSIGEVVGEIGQCFDLVMLGQSDAPESPDIAATVITRSGRPVLVLPVAGPVEMAGRTPLLVWDNEPASARALNDALAVWDPQCRPIVLILTTTTTIDTDKTEALLAHLRAHGIDARAEHVMVGQSAPDDLILNRAADLGADLVVAGWSATYGPGLLRHLTVPVLLAG